MKIPQGESKRYRKLANVRAKYYPNEGNDCSVKAVAMAGSVSYGKARAALARQGREEGEGVQMMQILNALAEVTGKRWDLEVGHGVKTLATAKKLGAEPACILTDQHISYYAEGRVHDWAEGSRKRIVGVFRAGESTLYD